MPTKFDHNWPRTFRRCKKMKFNVAQRMHDSGRIRIGKAMYIKLKMLLVARNSIHALVTWNSLAAYNRY